MLFSDIIEKMCRLLFLKTTRQVKEHLQRFKHQRETPKYTPFLNNEIDAEYHRDGMGFAWFIDDHWSMEKSVDESGEIPRSDHWLESDYVIGHLRHKGNFCQGDKSNVNTHPFQWQSFLFCHNGYILNFHECESMLVSHLLPCYRKERKGETDSELLFYLLLSLLDSQHTMKQSILALDQLLTRHSIQYYGNFIWTNESYCYITRLTNTLKEPCSLYIDKDAFIISSEPITTSFELIPAQTILEINLSETSIRDCQRN